MTLSPEATLDGATQTAIAAAYGLGEPVAAIFVARGAMGAVNRLETERDGMLRQWTVKRSYWRHYTEPALAAEVNFTRQCAAAGVPAPGSIARVDGGGYMLTLDDQGDSGTQYRVLEWIAGEVDQAENARTIPRLADWMARVHTLAVDPAGQPIDDWFVRVKYDWDDLAGRLAARAPDVAALLRARRADLRDLTDFVNATPHAGAVWCHRDLAASNLVWGAQGPRLLDWENAGPLVPVQELGMWVRSLGPLGKAAYLAYRRAGGPAAITDVTHLATSVAVDLNYVGVQAELCLDDNHPEQHDFARAQVSGAAQSLYIVDNLDEWLTDLTA